MILRGRARILLLLSGLVVACGGEPDESRALYELERMTFVPAASRCRLFLYDCSIPEALLVDRFELTRADWLHYNRGEPTTGPLTSDVARYGPGREDWPAFLTHGQARAVGEQRGMRLLTAREWIHVACGPRGYAYPSGQRNFQASVANSLDLGLGRPAPVGTFESGRSRPFGCYDLIGNVWEWVADHAPAFYPLPEEELIDRVGPGTGIFSAMGGSFRSAPRPVYARVADAKGRLVFHALSLDGRHLSADIGARFGIEAAAYLFERAPRWGRGERVRERLRHIGKSWGRAALALLKELAARPGAAPGLGWLAEGAAEARF